MLMFILFLFIFGLFDPPALPPCILTASIGVSIPFWNWALWFTFCSAFCEVMIPGGPVGFTKLPVSIGSNLRFVLRMLGFSFTFGSSWLWFPPPRLPPTFYNFGIQGPLLVIYPRPGLSIPFILSLPLLYKWPWTFWLRILVLMLGTRLFDFIPLPLLFCAADLSYY